MASGAPLASWRYESKDNSTPAVLTREDGTLCVAFHTVNGTDAWSNTYYGFPDPQPNNVHFYCTEVDAHEECVLEATVLVAPTMATGRYDQAGLMVRISPTCWLKASIEYIPDAASHWGSVCTNNGWSDWATQDITPPAMPATLRTPGSGSEAQEAHRFLKAQAGAPITAAQYRVHRLRHGDYVIEGRLCDVTGAPMPAIPHSTGGETSTAQGQEAKEVPWTQLRMCHLVEDPWSAQHPACGAGGSGQRPPPVRSEPNATPTWSGKVQVGVYACSPLGPGCPVHFHGIKLQQGRLFPLPH